MSTRTCIGICHESFLVVAALAVAIALSGLFGCDRVHQSLNEQLIYHAKRGDARGVYLCLLARADINAYDNSGSSALHLAVEGDFRKTVGLLVKQGANLEAKDGQGRTALHIAAL